MTLTFLCDFSHKLIMCPADILLQAQANLQFFFVRNTSTNSTCKKNTRLRRHIYNSELNFDTEIFVKNCVYAYT